MLEDFDHGRAHMLKVACLEVQQWESLPKRLVALVDDIQVRWRESARSILEDFGKGAPENRHRITPAWLRPVSALQRDIDLLVAGACVPSLPLLWQFWSRKQSGAGWATTVSFNGAPSSGLVAHMSACCCGCPSWTSTS